MIRVKGEVSMGVMRAVAKSAKTLAHYHRVFVGWIRNKDGFALCNFHRTFVRTSLSSDVSTV
jgi:hypothetical protein